MSDIDDFEERNNPADEADDFEAWWATMPPPMPPFPSEPPPGSPEAVAVAAKTISSFSYEPALPGHSREELAVLLAMRPPYSLSDLAKIPRLLDTLERLLAENESLRVSLRYLEMAPANAGTWGIFEKKLEREASDGNV